MKKILYLSHRIPYPPNKGDKIRSFNEIKYLSKRYDVDLITLADDPKDIKYKKDLKKYCRRVKVFSLNTRAAQIRGLLSLLNGHSISQGYFYSKAFQSLFDQWIKQQSYNALICFSSPMAEYVFKSSLNVAKAIYTLIMDFCDLDSDKWHQYAQKKPFPLNLLYRLEGVRLLAFEKKINRSFSRSIFVSHQEADLFRQYFPEANQVNVVPNGVDFDYFNPDLVVCKAEQEGVPTIGFFGAMDYYANVDGALWFTNRIWPLVKKQIPDAVFLIVGSNPDQRLEALQSDPSIRVTGFVDDIREYYQMCCVCVVPLRIARGVQNKVLEAMSMAKPVVATSSSVQGIGIWNKHFISIEDEPSQFAVRIIELLQDQQQRKNVGHAARKYIKRHLSWKSNMALLK